jgi:hypothetical protein
MSTISSHIGAHGTRARRNVARSLWRDMSIGLAVALVVLTMIVLGTLGRSAIETDGSWPGVEVPRLEAPIAPDPRLDRFPPVTPSEYIVL